MAVDARRQQRMGREIQLAIASYLIQRFGNSLPGLTTVTRVQMSADLRRAQVWISVIAANAENEKAEKEQAVEFLQKNAQDIRLHVSKTLKLRFCPKMVFGLDFGTEHTLKVDRILHNLELERQGRTPLPGNPGDNDDGADSDGDGDSDSNNDNDNEEDSE
jgi:ribosome-binding factor A